MAGQSTRRRLLRSGALGTVLGLAGCLRLSSNNTATPSPTAGPPITDEPGTEPPTESPVENDGDQPRDDTGGQRRPTAPLTDWPTFRTDPAGTGYHPDATGPTEGVAELFRVESDEAITTSPVLADGLLYYTARTETVNAVDAATGEISWSQNLPVPAPTGSPTVADGRLFVGNSEGTLFALDTDTGAFVWEWSTDAEGIWGSPIVANETLYVGDVRGGLHVLDPADCTHQWTYQTEGKWHVSTPAVDPNDGTVYASTMNSLELPDGHEEFFFDYTDSPGQIFQWFGSNEFDRFGQIEGEGTVEAVDGDSGVGLWQTSFPDFVVSSPAIANGRLFVGCWDHSLYRLDATDGTEQWTAATAGPISGSPSVTDGQVFITSGRGDLYNVDVSNGERNWFVPINGPVTSAPSIIDEAVYISTNLVGVLAVDWENGRKLWQHRSLTIRPTRPPHRSFPAIASTSPAISAAWIRGNRPATCSSSAD